MSVRSNCHRVRRVDELVARKISIALRAYRHQSACEELSRTRTLYEKSEAG